MITNFLGWLQEKIMSFSKHPWSAFETNGMDKDGRIGWSMRWNQAFIKHLNAAGFQGLSDEETVQQFFMMSQMLPEELANQGTDVVNPAATPNLTSEANTLRR
jgi:hypothetical protein